MHRYSMQLPQLLQHQNSTEMNGFQRPSFLGRETGHMDGHQQCLTQLILQDDGRDEAAARNFLFARAEEERSAECRLWRARLCSHLDCTGVDVEGIGLDIHIAGHGCKEFDCLADIPVAAPKGQQSDSGQNRGWQEGTGSLEYKTGVLASLEESRDLQVAPGKGIVVYASWSELCWHLCAVAAAGTCVILCSTNLDTVADVS